MFNVSMDQFISLTALIFLVLIRKSISSSSPSSLPSSSSSTSSTSTSTSSLITSSLSSSTLSSDISGSKYKALIGGKIELPCNVSTSTNNDAVTTIFWYKGDTQGSPIYTVDARNSSTNLDSANRFTSEYLKGRVSFNISVQFAFLIISPVREEDNGAYRCRVDFRWSRTVNTLVYLEVIVPAKKVIIADETNQIVESLGSYGEGTSLKLKCLAYGGKPAPLVYWYLNQDLIDDSYISKVTEDGLVTINDLFISKLGRNDLNKLLSCKTFNTNLTQAINKSLILDINLYPFYVKIISIRRPLSADKSIELQCDSKGSRPGAKMTWYLNQQLLKSWRETNSVINGSTSSSSILKFVPSPADNGALLTCKAENSRLLNSSIKDDWILNIYYKPNVKLVLRLSSHPSEINENDEIIFECIIDSNPVIQEIGWLFNESPLLPDERRGIIIDNTTLVIKVAQKNHSGDYSCFAVNIEGKGFSNKATIKVNHSPVCVKDQKTIYIAGLGETVRISCSIEAEPSQVEIIWKINDTLLDEGVYPFQPGTAKLSSNLLYQPRRSDDYGTLMCLAKNRVGTIKEPCQFIVMPAGRPERMVNCLVSNQTGESLVISCQPGHDGGLNQTFYLQVYDYRREKLLFNLTSTLNPTFLVNGLTSGASYVFDVYSSNPKGSSNTTTLIAQTLSMQKQKLGLGENLAEIKFDPYLAVLSALIFTLVLVAIIIILIITIRNREDKCDSRKTVKPIESVDEPESQGPDVVPSSTRSNVATFNMFLQDNSQLGQENLNGNNFNIEVTNNDVDTSIDTSNNDNTNNNNNVNNINSNNNTNNVNNLNNCLNKKQHCDTSLSNGINFTNFTVIKKNMSDGSSFDGDYGFTQITSIDDFGKCIAQYMPFDDKACTLSGTMDRLTKPNLDPNSIKQTSIGHLFDGNDGEYTYSTPV
ncbi:protein turtle-like isoform X2 [Tetranychus urticae]|uniref:protein turtle-like isoform X2 n=1 Tax=Tetranychus urticae TaxID=32264 RepID=UPI00077BF2AB|nr:protein turtle-like isoform X2 [Tetranychus urticae]